VRSGMLNSQTSLSSSDSTNNVFLCLLIHWYNKEPFKSDFFYRAGDKWHKTQKSKFEIFCPEIAHGMPIHLAYFFCLKVLFFSRKKNPNQHYLSLWKMGQNSNDPWVYTNARLMYFCKAFWTNSSRKSGDGVFPGDLVVKARILTKY